MVAEKLSVGGESGEQAKRRAETIRSREDFEREEKEKNEAYRKMQQYAFDVGCRTINNPAMRFIEFETWQDALDFQTFCKEDMKFDVRVVEPPQKDHSVFKQGFRVFPVWGDKNETR